MGTDSLRRYWLQFRIFSIRDGWKKAAYIKKHHLFYYIGENVFYTSNLMPSEPFLVCLHNNIVISAGVRLITHDVSHVIFNTEDNSKQHLCRYGKVEIHDNVYVGANAIIMYGVTINRNCIIGAGALVTHDVPEGSVVAGVPAKVIKTYEEAKVNSLEFSSSFGAIGDKRTVSDLSRMKPVNFELDRN